MDVPNQGHRAGQLLDVRLAHENLLQFAAELLDSGFLDDLFPFDPFDDVLNIHLSRYMTTIALPSIKANSYQGRQLARTTAINYNHLLIYRRRQFTPGSSSFQRYLLASSLKYIVYASSHLIIPIRVRKRGKGKEGGKEMQERARKGSLAAPFELWFRRDGGGQGRSVVKI